MTAWRLSYSPRNAAAIRLATSSVPRLLKLPRSADICTTDLDIFAASEPPNPIWVNMSPNEAAASNAACRDNPKLVAAPFAHESIAAKFDPKIACDLLTVSFRSLAALVAESKPLTSAEIPIVAANPPARPFRDPPKLAANPPPAFLPALRPPASP